jgi:4-alpha-glucanotransferase
MNTPSTTGGGNWRWRLDGDNIAAFDSLAPASGV